MAKKPSTVIDIRDYIPAQEAAHILTLKFGRRIDPTRINKLRNRRGNAIRFIQINPTTFWYHKSDIQNAIIGNRRRRCKQCKCFDCSGHVA